MHPLKQNLVTADGQITAVATQITTGAACKAKRLNVILSNVGSASETVVVTTVRGGGSNLTGVARRVHRAVLEPDESLHLRGVPLNYDDSLLAQTTNEGAVDYLVSMAADEAEMNFAVYDDSGLPKANPQIAEQLAAVFSA